MIEELSERIWKREAFQNEYKQLLQENLSRSISIRSKPTTILNRGVIRRLLQSATHFSASSHPEYRKSAYRIATATLQLFGNEYDNIPEVASFILSRLGNFPAVNYLKGRSNSIDQENIPSPLWFEVEEHRQNNSISISDQINLTLTDFQKKLWDSLSSGTSISVTAPTSAGKSFALQRYLIHTLLQQNGWGLYIVPTRTLINQVSESLLALTRLLKATDLAIATVPVHPEELGKPFGIYVLTQERLQFLLELETNIVFRLAIVDEAQMIGDGSRGIILQTVIEKIRSKNPNTQFFFCSPQASNPDVFQRIFNLSNTTVIQERESPVAQNFIFIDRIRRTRDILVAAQIENNRLALGRVSLDSKLEGSNATLAYISWFFGGNEKSLIYAGRADNCERIAAQLRQLSNQGSNLTNQALSELSSFIREHIHPEYVLADCIENGIAFHYGNMPSIIRKAIESYFDEGHLVFLICTSTLLHGVNLPAKNLFLLNPTKSRNTPISSLEFWNLVGRAGRLGRDFEGNIYLINLQDWNSQPLEDDKYHEVQSSLNITLLDRDQNFIEFARDRDHQSGEKQSLENAFVKIFNDYRRGNLPQTLEGIFGEEASSLRTEIESIMEDTADLITVPDFVTERNITISVFRQQEMFEFITQEIKNNRLETLFPAHPLQSWDSALLSFQQLFKRIHTYFEKKSKTNKSQFFFAPLALRWMRGDSLVRIIDDAYEYQRRKKPKVQISTVIREVMKNIENDLRFRYVKYANCYNDLLAEALRQSGNSDLIESILPIPLFLEIGASSRTMVSLVTLGLSRTAAGILTSIIENREMTIEEVSNWLSSVNLDSMNVSNIVLREVRSLI